MQENDLTTEENEYNYKFCLNESMSTLRHRACAGLTIMNAASNIPYLSLKGGPLAHRFTLNVDSLLQFCVDAGTPADVCTTKTLRALHRAVPAEL